MDGGELFNRIQERGDQRFTERGTEGSLNFVMWTFGSYNWKYLDDINERFVVFLSLVLHCSLTALASWYHKNNDSDTDNWMVMEPI